MVLRRFRVLMGRERMRLMGMGSMPGMDMDMGRRIRDMRLIRMGMDLDLDLKDMGIIILGMRLVGMRLICTHSSSSMR